MKSREERICDGRSLEHQDAERLVQYLISYDGVVEATNNEIAGKLDMWKDVNGRFREVDFGRFYRARNHVKDRVNADGDPCCGYGLNYRQVGNRRSALTLFDPSGDLGDHAKAVIADIRGWVDRERQHRTENQRMTEQTDLLAEHTLARGDRPGHRLLVRASTDIERDGFIHPDTMAELEVWLASLGSAS